MSKYEYRLAEYFNEPSFGTTRTNIDARLIGRLAELAHRDGRQFARWPTVTWGTVEAPGYKAWVAQAKAEATEETS